LLQTIKAQNKRLVVLSGDSHNAWFANVTTLAGDKVGVEFAGSSVTAPGFESAGLGALASSLDGSVLASQLGTAAIGAGLGLIDDLNYSDTIRRGYLLMTITADQVKGEYVLSARSSPAPTPLRWAGPSAWARRARLARRARSATRERGERRMAP
jgi:alkaline phosphatase D